jgi:hypothetical protein
MNKRKLHVYIVHEEYNRKTKAGVYKILGVYLKREHAEEHRCNLLTKEYKGGYISVTQHSCRGGNEEIWKYFLPVAIQTL